MPNVTAVPAKSLPVVSEKQLKKLAEFVLGESAGGEVRSTVSIGRRVFLQLFRSSEEAFRSKLRNKGDSLNDLAAQPGMAEAGWSRARLGRAVEIALMAKVHNYFRAWPFLRVSHFEEVIGLPADKQRELLDQAAKEGWSVVRLSQEAGKQRPSRPAAAPAPGSVKPDKALGRIRKAMDQVAALAGSGTALAPCLVEAGIDAQAAAELTAALENVLGLLEGFQKQLEQTKRRSAGKLKRVAGKIAAPG